MASRSKRTAGLIDRIMLTSLTVRTEAARRGLGRYLADQGQATVKPCSGTRFVSAYMSHLFQPNHGVQFELMSLVTDDDHAAPLDPARKAGLIVDWMEWLRPRAAEVAATRRAIAAAAAEVIAEAKAEGIELELLGGDRAPVHTYRHPKVQGHRQVFYVRLVMDHDDDGEWTRDAYDIDADDPAELAEYLRRRTLPELRADREARRLAAA